MDQQLEGRQDKRYDSQVKPKLYIICMLVKGAQVQSTVTYILSMIFCT